MKHRDQTREEFVKSCVVRVQEPGKEGWGTGFFVARDLILTCAHVCGQPTYEGKIYNFLLRSDQSKSLCAKLKKIIPSKWPDDQCYPDIALLQADKAPSDQPYVRLNSDYQPGDFVWGHGFSGDRPGGEALSGHISGTASFNTGEERSDLDHELIKFLGDQIGPGLSGSPLVNQRTGGVCGMVKKTRDSTQDRGGHAVQIRVICDRLRGDLPGTSDSRHKRVSLIQFLQETFGNRTRATLGSLIYAVLAIIVGLIGLFFSYGPLSSPAWEADFGYAFSDIQWDQTIANAKLHGQRDTSGHLKLDSEVLANRNSVKGGFIEGLRLLLLATLFVILTGFIFNNTYVQIEEIPAPFTAGWWRSFGTGLFITVLVFVFVVLAIYNLFAGPRTLSTSPKFWSDLASVQQLWSNTPSFEPGFWQNLFQKVPAKEVEDLKSAFYERHAWMIYFRPYACYFLYSISTFLLLATPVLMISGRALWHSTHRILRELREIENLYAARADSRRINSLSARFEDAIVDNFDWYASCLLAVGLVAAFEYLVGRDTLAPVAYAFTTLGMVLFWLALAFPTFALCRHLALTRGARPILAQEQDSVSPRFLWNRRRTVCAAKIAASTASVSLSVIACLKVFNLL